MKETLRGTLRGTAYSTENECQPHRKDPYDNPRGYTVTKFEIVIHFSIRNSGKDLVVAVIHGRQEKALRGTLRGTATTENECQLLRKPRIKSTDKRSKKRPHGHRRTTYEVGIYTPETTPSPIYVFLPYKTHIMSSYDLTIPRVTKLRGSGRLPSMCRAMGYTSSQWNRHRRRRNGLRGCVRTSSSCFATYLAVAETG